MKVEVYFEIERVQYMFQRYLHDYIKCCFSDMDWHLKELSMFIHEFYVSGELTGMFIGYEIVKFL